jgi:hypothetical protein
MQRPMFPPPAYYSPPELHPKRATPPVGVASENEKNRTTSLLHGSQWLELIFSLSGFEDIRDSGKNTCFLC